MKIYALTLAMLLILLFVSCASSGAPNDTAESIPLAETIDSIVGPVGDDSAECYQIPLPDEGSSDTSACDYSKFKVKRSGGETFKVDDDESLIYAINKVIKQGASYFDKIEISVYFKTQGHGELLDALEYTEIAPIYYSDDAINGRDFMLYIEYEKIDIEALKALTLEDEVVLIEIGCKSLDLPS